MTITHIRSIIKCNRLFCPEYYAFLTFQENYLWIVEYAPAYRQAAKQSDKLRKPIGHLNADTLFVVSQHVDWCRANLQQESYFTRDRSEWDQTIKEALNHMLMMVMRGGEDNDEYICCKWLSDGYGHRKIRLLYWSLRSLIISTDCS